MLRTLLYCKQHRSYSCCFSCHWTYCDCMLTTPQAPTQTHQACALHAQIRQKEWEDGARRRISTPHSSTGNFFFQIKNTLQKATWRWEENADCEIQKQPCPTASFKNQMSVNPHTNSDYFFSKQVQLWKPNSLCGGKNTHFSNCASNILPFSEF